MFNSFGCWARLLHVTVMQREKSLPHISSILSKAGGMNTHLFCRCARAHTPGWGGSQGTTWHANTLHISFQSEPLVF